MCKHLLTDMFFGALYNIWLLFKNSPTCSERTELCCFNKVLFYFSKVQIQLFRNGLSSLILVKKKKRGLSRL